MPHRLCARRPSTGFVLSPLSSADKLLIDALSSDADARVRLEAAFALGYRGASRAAFEAERRAFLADKDEKVRGALLADLAKMRQGFPEVRELIEQAAENDSSDYVRKVARELLQRMPVDSSGPD
jgi:HEAT repeat protein